MNFYCALCIHHTQNTQMVVPGLPDNIHNNNNNRKPHLVSIDLLKMFDKIEYTYMYIHMYFIELWLIFKFNRMMPYPTNIPKTI